MASIRRFRFIVNGGGSLCSQKACCTLALLDNFAISKTLQVYGDHHVCGCYAMLIDAVDEGQSHGGRTCDRTKQNSAIGGRREAREFEATVQAEEIYYYSHDACDRIVSEISLVRSTSLCYTVRSGCLECRACPQARALRCTWRNAAIVGIQGSIIL